MCIVLFERVRACVVWLGLCVCVCVCVRVFVLLGRARACVVYD